MYLTQQNNNGADFCEFLPGEQGASSRAAVGGVAMVNVTIPNCFFSKERPCYYPSYPTTDFLGKCVPVPPANLTAAQVIGFPGNGTGTLSLSLSSLARVCSFSHTHTLSLSLSPAFSLYLRVTLFVSLTFSLSTLIAAYVIGRYF